MHMKVVAMFTLEHVNLKVMSKLSHQSIDDLKWNARIDAGEHKEDALDFTLWKKRSLARLVGIAHLVKVDQDGI